MRRIYARLFCSVMVLAVSNAVNGIPPPAPDFGLKGLQAVHLLFDQTVNKATRDQTIDMSDPCGDTVDLFAQAGLPIAKGADNPAVGHLFLTIERSAPQEAGVLYLVEISLSQDMRLVREPDRKLSVPVTYSDRHYGLVAAASAKAKTCEELHAMVSEFLEAWQGQNRLGADGHNPAAAQPASLAGPRGRKRIMKSLHEVSL